MPPSRAVTIIGSSLIAACHPGPVGRSWDPTGWALQVYRHGALLFWVVANVIAYCAATGSTTLGFTFTLFFYVGLCRVEHRDRRCLACKKTEDGKSSHSEDEFPHFSSPSVKRWFQTLVRLTRSSRFSGDPTSASAKSAKLLRSEPVKSAPNWRQTCQDNLAKGGAQRFLVCPMAR